METFDTAVEELRRLGDITPEVGLQDFTAAFHRLMEETVLPIGLRHVDGVQVLDALAARGVPFRALYVMGLNEKVFPRHIREDAFLRDPIRRVLDADLGFKIQEKLAGYDEEKLLFSLLCRSAGDQLTLVYQRADETGRALVPSSYVAELQRKTGLGEHSVPRRLARKFQESPQYQRDRLTLSELAAKSLLERRVPRRLLQEHHPSGRLVERGLSALEFLDAGRRPLGSYDGITGPLNVSWQGLKTAGVSPSGLQEYATCPFRYFAKQVLRLRPPTVPETIDQVGPLEIGTLVHASLRRCLAALSAQGYFTRRAQWSGDPLAVLEEAARRECERFAATHPVGYHLLWTLHQERLVEFLKTVLRDDLDEMARDGWEPVLFEEDMVGRLTVPDPDGRPEEIAVAGRLDRIDWRRTRNAYRIVDYKFKSRQEPDLLDKNLNIGAVRATRLQPPLYLMMAEAITAALPGAPRDARCAGVWFYYLAPEWEQPVTRVEFPGDAWTSPLQGPMRQAIGHVLSGIRAGRFFIYPSGSCERCDYRLLCRKSHQPTAWRARADHAVVVPYRNLRKATPPKDASGDPPDRLP
jgi:ATP-dependent helicase/nuclease subunit B